MDEVPPLWYGAARNLRYVIVAEPSGKENWIIVTVPYDPTITVLEYPLYHYYGQVDLIKDACRRLCIPIPPALTQWKEKDTKIHEHLLKLIKLKGFGAIHIDTMNQRIIAINEARSLPDDKTLLTLTRDLLEKAKKEEKEFQEYHLVVHNKWEP